MSSIGDEVRYWRGMFERYTSRGSAGNLRPVWRRCIQWRSRSQRLLSSKHLCSMGQGQFGHNSSNPAILPLAANANITPVSAQIVSTSLLKSIKQLISSASSLVLWPTNIILIFTRNSAATNIPPFKMECKHYLEIAIPQTTSTTLPLQFPSTAATSFIF